MLVLTQLFQTIMRLACGMRTLNQSRQQSRKKEKLGLPAAMRLHRLRAPSPRTRLHPTPEGYLGLGVQDRRHPG